MRRSNFRVVIIATKPSVTPRFAFQKRGVTDRGNDACRYGRAYISSSAKLQATGGHMTGTVIIELEDETLRALDRLAHRTDRSRNELVSRAVQDYLDLQAWQIEKIESGIAAADQGEFATDADLDRIAGKYSALK
jgi:predicted transcriptional regulator